MKNLDAIHDQSVNNLKAHWNELPQLQSSLLDDVPQILSSVQLVESINRKDYTNAFQFCHQFISDPLTIHRFYQKSKFDTSATIQALHNTLRWRLSHTPEQQELDSTESCSNAVLHHDNPVAHLNEQNDEVTEPLGLDLLLSDSYINVARKMYPELIDDPVIFYHEKVNDKFDRPAAIVNFRNVKKGSDGTTTQLKRHIVLSLELGRRYLEYRSKQQPIKIPPEHQLVIIVDLAGSSTSNIEVELLSFLIDIVGHHFPNLVGRIYLANFSWYHSGMWTLCKQFLPKKLLDRIMFPSRKDFEKEFGQDHLLSNLGGNIDYTFKLEDNVPIQLIETASQTPSDKPNKMILQIPPIDMSNVGPSSTPHLDSPKYMTPAVEYSSISPFLEKTKIQLPPDSSTSTLSPQGDTITAESELVVADSFWNTYINKHIQKFVSSFPLSAASQRNSNQEQNIDADEADDDIEINALIKAQYMQTKYPGSRFSSTNPFYGYRTYVPAYGSHMPQIQGIKRKRDLIRTLSYLMAMRVVWIHQRMSKTLAKLSFLPHVAGMSWALTILSMARKLILDYIALVPDILRRLSQPIRKLAHHYGRDNRLLLTTGFLLALRAFVDKDTAATTLSIRP